MKVTLCLLAACVAVATSASIDIDTGEGWFVPLVEGGFKWKSKQQYEAESRQLAGRATVSVTFHLYTKSNPTSGKQVTLNDASSLSMAGFNKAHPTRILIHGWQNGLTASVNTVIRSALFAIGDYNVFCVDWSATAMTANYASARYSVPSVGAIVAKFIDFLNEKGGMSFDTLGLVGHSLGAHVSGFAGKDVTRGKVHTIEGLDPALPLFSYSNCATRLCSTDASYVESIQTNGGTLGFLDPIGKAAFYPNGGKSQPGCGVDLTGGCAHERSVLYYGESIKKNDFPSLKCGTYESAVNKDCGSTYSSVRMGAESNYAIRGYYYVPVKSSSPYGYGS